MNWFQWLWFRIVWWFKYSRKERKFLLSAVHTVQHKRSGEWHLLRGPEKAAAVACMVLQRHSKKKLPKRKKTLSMYPHTELAVKEAIETAVQVVKGRRHVQKKIDHIEVQDNTTKRHVEWVLNGMKKDARK